MNFIKHKEKYLVMLSVILSISTGYACAGTISAPEMVVTKLNIALIDSMKMGPSSGYQQRFHALYPVISNVYNFSKIAHYSLGSAWNRMSSQKKHEFVHVLTNYSVANYAAHFDHYSGQKFSKPISKNMAVHRVMVSSTLQSPNDGQKNTFVYLLIKNNSRWKIVNVSTDGVSNLAMQKAEFKHSIHKGGINALLEQITAHTAKLSRPEK